MKTLAYPDFTAPAALSIVIGAAFLIANFLLDLETWISWAIPSYLIATGVFLARRKWLGTALLVIGLTGILIIKIESYFIQGMAWNVFQVAKDLLGFLILAGLVTMVISQIRHFKSEFSKADLKAEQNAAGQPATRIESE